MFISLPHSEEFVPPTLLPQGGKAWRALELAITLPWFILTVRESWIDPKGKRMNQCRTLMLCWDSDLSEMIQNSPADRFVALQCIVPGHVTEDGKWRLRSVHAVWEVQVPDADGGPAMVLEDAEGEFGPSLDYKAPARSTKRRLLLELPR